MSLDVYLKRKLEDYNSLSNDTKSELHSGYSDHLKWDTEKLSFEDWFKENNFEEVYDANITHNLGKIAQEAGIYEALWRPYQLKDGYDVPDGDHEAEYKFEEENPSVAKDIIEVLEKGLKDLKSRPEYFKTFDSPNGWGLYIHFLPFVEDYLNACLEFPDATIEVSR